MVASSTTAKGATRRSRAPSALSSSADDSDTAARATASRASASAPSAGAGAAGASAGAGAGAAPSPSMRAFLRAGPAPPRPASRSPLAREKVSTSHSGAHPRMSPSPTIDRRCLSRLRFASLK